MMIHTYSSHSTLSSVQIELQLSLGKAGSMKSAWNEWENCKCIIVYIIFSAMTTSMFLTELIEE